MYPEIEFLKYLRFKRSLLACDEVATYGCIADVLAVDKNKKHVLEYEFKQSSNDLRVLEKKKTKYGKRAGWKRICNKTYYIKGLETKKPHRFYFVMPQELWEKEKGYLEKQTCGVIIYYTRSHRDIEIMEFVTVKICKLRKKNLQKYEVVSKDLLVRCTSAYVSLLGRTKTG